MESREHIFTRYALLIAGTAILVAAAIMVARNFMIPLSDTAGKPIQEPSSPSHKVLFLDSYSPTHSSYPLQEEGLKKGLYKNNISYDVIYMDTKNYNSEKDLEDFYRFFKTRVEGSGKTWDGVIAGDDAALSFILIHQDEFFKNLPVVFYGINNISLAERAAKKPNITGFTEETYLGDTLDLAVKLLPEADTIAAIIDQTPTGIGDRNSFWEYRIRYSSFKFREINTSKMTRREFEKELEGLDKNTILIYLTAFEDSEGNKYTIPESVQTIVEHTKIPVFRNYSEGIGEGILGGTLMNFPEQCYLAGVTMSDVLSGNRKIEEIALYTETSGIVKYDWQQMKRFDLNLKMLPPETQFVNKPKSYVDQYGNALIPVLMIVLGLLVILAALAFNYAMLKNAEEKLKYDAEHDRLLDIYNRSYAETYLSAELAKGRPLSMLRIDVDNFKAINDTYGHIAGDRYLKHAADLLKTFCREHDYFVARYSSDEFIVIITGQHLMKDSWASQAIHELFREPMQIGTEGLKTTVSIGIVNSDADATVESMFVNADIAMTTAKEYGKNTSALFTPDFQEKSAMINRTRTKVLSAMENEDYYMLYQPKVDARTKELVGYEALIRMRGDDALSPGMFIPIAEQSGLISQIGRITTEFAVRQLAEWRDKGVPLLPVSINYSSNQINDEGYVQFLKNLLEKYDIDPCYIEIEITEGLFMESTWQAGKLFVQLRALGIKILMDDFGTGYSSLSYLTYIPVDILKLDKSLVTTYLVEGKDSFIRDVISLAHDLGKKMIIEGVEEEWQYERLREFGADVIQGYYFSRPLPPEQAANWHCDK